jgi:4-diphosphocytidyl-2-C-methyl-D-erythritol kinase
MLTLPSFAKINLGLKIGPRRPDGFHELRTIYQTLALHDRIGVEVQAGSGVEIRCDDPRVPRDGSNTCWKIAESVMGAFPQRPKPDADPGRHGAPEGAPLQRKIIIEIEKHLPVQGGLGAASSNAVVTMLAMERALNIELSQADKLRIAAEVGSDLPLFLIGGTVLGLGRGEEVYALPDLPTLDMVIVMPPVGVSTPRAFAQWDEVIAQQPELTPFEGTGTINQPSKCVLDLLSEGFPWVEAVSNAGVKCGGEKAEPASGVPAVGGDRAETLLLDLVRTGIENDFERVVFPEHPELREVKELLQRAGAEYASLSGSGSTLYGVFATPDDASSAAERMRAAGHAAVATRSLARQDYWTAVASS